MDGEANGSQEAKDAQGAQALQQQGQAQDPQGGEQEIAGLSDDSDKR